MEQILRPTQRQLTEGAIVFYSVCLWVCVYVCLSVCVSVSQCGDS